MNIDELYAHIAATLHDEKGEIRARLLDGAAVLVEVIPTAGGLVRHYVARLTEVSTALHGPGTPAPAAPASKRA